MSTDREKKAFDQIGESEFRKRIKLGAPSGLPRKYFFYGDEDYLKNVALRLARESVAGGSEFDCAGFDARNFSPAALSEALAVPPMFGENRLVTVCLSPSDLRPSDMNALTEIAAGIEDDGWEFLIISFPAGSFDPGYPGRPSAALKKLASAAVPVFFDRVSGARLNGWVSKHYSENGVTADGVVCSDTVAFCGTGMFRLASEIEKISCYVLASGRTAVTRADVAAAGSRTVEFDGFALANAVLRGDGAGALRVLSTLKARKEDPIAVMSEIIRTACDMRTVELCRADGMTPAEISAATGLHPFPVKKYLEALDRAEPGKTARLVSACRDADAAIKSGTPDYLPIEVLVCTV
ncbi:MAG: DNA polymerase III subunit delta [Clostridia bacterium]|nr:DNA polymerase III subunit delta [Clostridia bacterium]